MSYALNETNLKPAQINYHLVLLRSSSCSSLSSLELASLRELLKQPCALILCATRSALLYPAGSSTRSMRCWCPLFSQQSLQRSQSGHPRQLQRTPRIGYSTPQPLQQQPRWITQTLLQRVEQDESLYLNFGCFFAGSCVGSCFWHFRAGWAALSLNSRTQRKNFISGVSYEVWLVPRHILQELPSVLWLLGHSQKLSQVGWPTFLLSIFVSFFAYFTAETQLSPTISCTPPLSFVGTTFFLLKLADKLSSPDLISRAKSWQLYPLYTCGSAQNEEKILLAMARGPTAKELLVEDLMQCFGWVEAERCILCYNSEQQFNYEEVQDLKITVIAKCIFYKIGPKEAGLFL